MADWLKIWFYEVQRSYSNREQISQIHNSFYGYKITKGAVFEMHRLLRTTWTYMLG